MEINRRLFISGLAAASFITLPSTIARADNQRPTFITTSRDRLSGKFVLTCIDDKLEIAWDSPLPGRAHDIVVAPNMNQGVVIARRPGLFAMVFDIDSGDPITTIEPISGRHFYGHATFSHDGRTLFMTENAYDEGVGVIGIYDAENQYRRLGEFKSGGVGPHDIALLRDGHTLAVANGGIRTHPDTGRQKLNLETMASSLAFIESHDGRMIKNISIPGTDSQSLSIRHMTVTKNDIVVGCQNQSPSHVHPLMYRCGVAKQNALVALVMPAPMKKQFSGYCGSVAYDARSNTVAVTSPIGGVVGLWDSADDFAWLGNVQLPDGCGVDGASGNGGFILSSGEGDLSLISSDGMSRAQENYPFRQWDNHLVSV